MSFNPRAHAGRDLGIILIGQTELSFNPRAHAGRDTYEVLSFRNNLVSIHAPTRGATIHVLPYLGLFRFQSTRPRGARRLIRASLMGFSGFNPRAHAGRDSAPCVRKTN